MMFNGLLMCGDSDTSDFTKESIGASSVSADTCSSAWDADARATYYHGKLLSTLQVLQNKEETVRVQAESLRVAEARAQLLRDQLDHKEHQLRSAQSAAHAQRADVATDAAAQEVKTQKALVRTLQTNLSVIEELYRECFYEAAKQEELIDGLRQSYLDARAGERQKEEDILRLRRVIHDQHWSMEQCQGIATEVDNLKLEISNFLNSSNNDSGMWERGEDASVPPDVLDDLRHISDQLLQLRAMLAGNCSCGLEEENMRLKTANETMAVQVSELQQRVSELEAAVLEREDGEQVKKELEEKTVELDNVRQQLVHLEDVIKEKSEACDAYAEQLQRSQEEHSRQLSEALEQCAKHEAAVTTLQQEVNRCNDVIQERASIANNAREHARELASELSHVTKRAQRLDENFREQAECARTLQLQLLEAHERGARLTDDVRRVLAAVRDCVRRMRHTHRNNEEKIKHQDTLISSLRHRLETSKSETGVVRIADDTCCTSSTQCISFRRGRCQELSNETASCSKCSKVKTRREDCFATSVSGPSDSAAPTPPKRLLRKKSTPLRTVQGRWCGTREAEVQQPYRADAACGSGAASARHDAGRTQYQCLRGDLLQREMSPSSELEERVEALQAALERSSRRWTHAHTR